MSKTEINYPNKIYVVEYKGENTFGNLCHFVIVIAASNIDVAETYVKEHIGLKDKATWLMNGAYPTIWNQTGEKPLDIQAKILYNGSFHTTNNRR